MSKSQTLTVQITSVCPDGLPCFFFSSQDNYILYQHVFWFMWYVLKSICDSLKASMTWHLRLGIWNIIKTSGQFSVISVALLKNCILTINFIAFNIIPSFIKGQLLFSGITAWHNILHMSQAMGKCVLHYMRTTKAQISLRMRAVWSAPLLFAA